MEDTPEQFDYNKYRDDTTVKAIAGIFKVLGEHGDDLAFDSKADTQKINDAIDMVAQKVVMQMIEHSVPEGDMQMLIETFQVVLHKIFNSIAVMKKGYEMEFLARSFNSRNPGSGHFSREYATIGDLYASLEKIRIEQKDDPKGYFPLRAKE